MSKCRPEMAEKIVDLLLRDPSTARAMVDKWQDPILPRNCPNCGTRFKPQNRSRKYCSRQCFLAKNALNQEAKDFIVAHRHLNCAQVLRLVKSHFKPNASRSAVYRVWRVSR